MKIKIFTAILLALFYAGMTLFAQTSPEGSTGWETLQPGYPKILEENFQDFPFFHSDFDPNSGNSNHTPDQAGYKDTTAFRLIPVSKDTIFYEFYQCAFAPNWMAAYAYRDSVDNAELGTPGTEPMTPEVTRGFVEVSRDYPEDIPTIHGHFIIDLRMMDFVEIVRYSHSSCGGNKRGFTLDYSVDDGVTWDTIRMQTGNASTSLPQPNSFNVHNSAFGMRWEDYVLVFEQNVLLRFTEAGGQTPRIHDLKIYGNSPTLDVHDYVVPSIEITCHNRQIFLSEISDVGIYNINGVLVKRADRVETLMIDDLPDGIYIVRAVNDRGIGSQKILNQ